MKQGFCGLEKLRGSAIFCFAAGINWHTIRRASLISQQYFQTPQKLFVTLP
jgi:hypothetical protein